MTWTDDAEAQLKEVPFFVRPIVRKKVESLASEAGLETIDGAFVAEAKARFGQK